MTVEVLSLMSRINKLRCLFQHESCECKCGLNEGVRNSKQIWNSDGCWRECKTLDNWSSCEEDYMWNPSTFNCECHKACKTKEYLDIINCLC